MAGSLRDTIKTLQTTFSSDVQSLPDELQQTIEIFLDRHHHIEDSDSQRLHEELLSVHSKYVSNNPQQHGLFVHVLRLLRPAIKGEKRLEEWWNLVIRPTVDAIGHKRHSIEDARDFLLGILIFDAEDDATGENAALSAQFTRKLMEAYLVRSKIPTGEGEIVSPEDEFIAQELEGILIAFGKRKPQELLSTIDEQLVKKDRRLTALPLLNAFLRFQPAHLHLVLETNVIEHLYSCLLIDTSGTAVDLALAALIMLLPHITSSLVANLPKLFIIYARILCWDVYSREVAHPTKPTEGHEPEKSEKSSDSEGTRALGSDPSWDPLPRQFNSIEALVPKSKYLFTFLYGLFPLNFMNFVRKPRRYLKMKNYPHAVELNLHQEIIRNLTEKHRMIHRLHPNFFITTPEDELTDNRWLKSDPADLVAECFGLCIDVPTTLDEPGPPPTAKLPEIPKLRKHSVRAEALLAPDDESVATSPTEVRSHNSSWRHTQSTTLTTPSIEPQKMPVRQDSSDHLEPALASSRETSPDGLTREGSFASKKPRPKSRHRSDGPTTPKTDTYGFFPTPPSNSLTQVLSKVPSSHEAGAGSDTYNTAVLQREVMLLKNDLKFERFQKAQYLNQIGQLQRKHIKDATVESQNQNTINANRALQQKLDEANRVYAQLKKEASLNKNNWKRYEEQLSNKLKAYREEEKHWQSELQMLRHELAKSKQECDTLKQLVIDSEEREHSSHNQLSTQSLDLREIDSLQQRLQDLEEQLRDYQFRELENDRAKEEKELLRDELHSAKLHLDSRDAELERLTKTYEQKLSGMQSRLNTAQQAATAPGQMPASVQQYVDNALAVSQSKLQQVKKNYARLLHKYTELELKTQEPEGGRHSVNSMHRPSSVLSLTQYADDVNKPLVGSREGTVSRLHSLRKPHAFSDPLLVDDDISFIEEGQRSNTYPERPTRFESLAGVRPLRGISPPASSTYEGTNNHDFATPTGLISTSRTMEPSVSTTKERVHGRGGVQNVARKAPKDKDKKEKSKVGGFRGLKGIM